MDLTKAEIDHYIDDLMKCVSDIPVVFWHMEKINKGKKWLLMALAKKSKTQSKKTAAKAK